MPTHLGNWVQQEGQVQELSRWTYTRSSFAAVAAGSNETRGSSRPEMPSKPHTTSPENICAARANRGRSGYASGDLETEAHLRSCFTPYEPWERGADVRPDWSPQLLRSIGVWSTVVLSASHPHDGPH